MATGTRSVLFGVHCFWWHWITVAAGWWMVHGRLPRGRAEWLAVCLHDLGYWGCTDIDGESGKIHPLLSVHLLKRLRCGSPVQLAHAAGLVLGHSRSFAKLSGIPTSSLYAPDKASVLFDPEWFYLLRATLSGEIYEFMANSGKLGQTKREWLRAYKAEIRQRIFGLKTL